MMATKFLSVLLFAILIHICKCKNERSYFKAAVFENRPAPVTDTMTQAEIMIANLKLIDAAAKEAAKWEVDIFVTSEYGITIPGPKKITKNYAVEIPNPKKVKFNPCDNKSMDEFTDALTSFSCMAKRYSMYVVANILDIHPCTIDLQTCAADGENCESTERCTDDNFMYNTDVAFDRNGNLIARYHKNHLYFELLDTPQKPEMITFDTDFGVFGMIVCFDSLFEDAVHLVKDYNVETLLFLTHWFDDILPFNGIEWQQSWAIANDVNFLAANKHVPGNSTLGSGIFTKKYGALGYTYNPDGKSKLLICNVPRHDSAPDSNCKRIIVEETGTTLIEEEETGEDFPLYCYDGLMGPPKDMMHDHRCYKHQTARHALTKLESPVGEVESCHDNFCCSLKYEANSMSEDYYLTAFRGENDVYNYFKWTEQTCLLIRCESYEGQECALFPSQAKTVFTFIEMKAKFNSKVIYPTVSSSRNRLVPKQYWTFKTDVDYQLLQVKSQNLEPILKVGMFSRNYLEDPPFIPFYNRSNPQEISFF